MEAPVLSVLTTVRNASRTIVETMRSSLAERAVSLEHVVVDNGCTDDTIAKVESLGDERVRVVGGPGTSISAALNVAYPLLRGPFMTRLDGDDLIPAGSLARRLRWLEANPEFGAVCGAFETMDSLGRDRVRLDTGDVAEEISAEMRGGKLRTHVGTFLVRTDVIRRMGGSREYFQSFEDLDFQYRLAEHCRVMYLPDLCLSYRLHAGSSVHSTASGLRLFFDEQADLFRRQRQERGDDDLMVGRPPPVPTAPTGAAMSAHDQLVGHLVGKAWSDFAAGRHAASVRTSLKALRQKPASREVWRSAAVLVLKIAAHHAKRAFRLR